MTKPRVFVTKFQPDWDFSSATEYGEVEFLTELEMKPEPVVGSYNEAVRSEIRNRLAIYVPGVDYVVMTASATNNFVVARILQPKGGMHNILRWNGRKYKYELFKI